MTALVLMVATPVLSMSNGALPAVPSLEVRPTPTPPVIDGVINPAEWTGAAHSDAFRQVTPLENAAPTERTELWLTYDADNIYVAIRCHDSAGLAGLRAYSMQRDRDTGSDDLVRIVLDPFHRQSDGYYFVLTAAGGKHDGLIQNNGQGNYQWDALWHGKVTRDAGGWSAEFAIPVKSLAFDPANDTWGFNVERPVRRKQEKMRWSNFVRIKSPLSLPDLGEIRGLAGLRQGRGIDFKPYASLTRHSQPTPDENEINFKPGFDLIWHVTPSLAATLTVNTDFADAEVDERQVNLGRFPLFFPEKRAFFLQDASLFTFGGSYRDPSSNFGGSYRDPLPFFSRRIGLAGDGTKVDLLGGLKLTGRVGPWTVGLLDVQMADHAGVDAKNLVVGRAALQVLKESSVGVTFTHGDPRSNGGNTFAGADFNYAHNHLPGNKTLNAHASAQFTDSDHTGGRGSAAVFTLNYPNEPFALSYNFAHIDSAFDPALGFVPRTGITQVHLWNRYRWIFKDRFIHSLDTWFETDHVMDLHGRMLERSMWFPGFRADTRAGDFFVLQYSDHREVLDAPFAISPGIFIPTGNHRGGTFHAIYRSARSRPVNLLLQYQHGGFFTGRRTDYEVEFSWRPSIHLELAAEWELSQIQLPQGDFDVRIVSAKAVYTFSSDLQLSLLGQYDNLSNELGVNFRLMWIVQPGNEIFFIINQGYYTSADYFRPTQNDTSLKAAWTYRF
ncbi:MAG: hypothetical protein EXS42_05055 [Lacunisphaera sp.]|nr:hypothetical protein [Lacunisphaera sp.]